MNTELLELLLADLDEEYSTGGFLALYEVSWTLAGLGLDRSNPTFAPLAREAYARFRAEHPDLVLAQGSWPDLLGSATRAGEDVDVDLDFDTRSGHGRPMLLLVHPDELADRGGATP